ncbi:MAG: hypothetical protein BIFFINMI_03364 [Phycisphaerae bacterium]|nr:hypothetical protein [Phycisphaerae bacterium]
MNSFNQPDRRNANASPNPDDNHRFPQLAAHREKNRLTKQQRDVARYFAANPGAGLMEAADACKISVTYLRKWMVDPEFQGYWQDLRRFWSLRERESTRQAAYQAAREARVLMASAPPRLQGRFLDACDRLLTAADRLLAVEMVERQDPDRRWPWSESVGFPGRDGPGGDRVAAAGGGAEVLEADTERRAAKPKWEVLPEVPIPTDEEAEALLADLDEDET